MLTEVSQEGVGRWLTGGNPGQQACPNAQGGSAVPQQVSSPRKILADGFLANRQPVHPFGTRGHGAPATLLSRVRHGVPPFWSVHRRSSAKRHRTSPMAILMDDSFSASQA